MDNAFNISNITLLFTGGERNYSSSDKTMVFEKHAIEPSAATAC